MGLAASKLVFIEKKKIRQRFFFFCQNNGAWKKPSRWDLGFLGFLLTKFGPKEKNYFSQRKMVLGGPEIFFGGGLIFVFKRAVPCFGSKSSKKTTNKKICPLKVCLAENLKINAKQRKFPKVFKKEHGVPQKKISLLKSG